MSIAKTLIQKEIERQNRFIKSMIDSCVPLEVLLEKKSTSKEEKKGIIINIHKNKQHASDAVKVVKELEADFKKL